MTNSEKRDYLDLFCKTMEDCDYCPIGTSHIEFYGYYVCADIFNEHITEDDINKAYEVVKDFRNQELKSRYGTEDGD